MSAADESIDDVISRYNFTTDNRNVVNVMKLILYYLGLADDAGEDNEIIREITTLVNRSPQQVKIQFMDDLNSVLRRLLEADKYIKDLDTTYPLITGLDEWQEMKKKMAKLQGLILLRVIKTQDCTEVTRALTNAVNQKLTAVNEVLETNLQQQMAPSATATTTPGLGQPPSGFAIGPSSRFSQRGGSNRIIKNLQEYNKYLKYKTKYLALKIGN